MLFEGKVMHRRISPVRHRFAYRIAMLLLDIDTIDTSTRNLRLFSYNKPGLFAFYDCDHGARNGDLLRPWVEQQLQMHDIKVDGGQVMLLSLPRMLGFAFNPLSIFYCFDQTGKLAAVIYEVKNTFGEQHAYVCPLNVAGQEIGVHTHEKRKAFFVSPFISMCARYRFRITVPGDTLNVLIREFENSKEIMSATLTTHQTLLSDMALARIFLKYPLLTWKVPLAIHWQAMRLWIKKAPRFQKPFHQN